MATLKIKNRDYQVDEHGYLYPPDQWDENFACGMAEAFGISSGLNERHWKLLRYLRKKFVEENTVPLAARACLDNDITLQELRALFPAGYHRGACKIAGINYRFLPVPAAAKKHRYKLDELGFLVDFTVWDLDFVDYIMKELGGSSATEEHWNVIRYLREYYEQHRNIPTVYEACAANHLSLKDLMKLFPDGYRRGACRLAGLPFHI